MKKQKFSRFHKIFTVIMILLLSSTLVISFMLGSTRADTRDDALKAPNYGQLSAVSFVDAGANYLSGIALDGAGKVWTWGWNQHGQLGINKGYGINSSNPNILGYAGGMVRIPYFVNNNINIVDVEAGYHYNLALDDNGIVYGWGHNDVNQLGKAVSANTTYPSGVGIIEPTPIEGLPKIKKNISSSTDLNGSFSMAIDVNDSLWVWGSNAYGVHGQGNTNNAENYRMVPHKVPFPAGVKIVHASGGGMGSINFVHALDNNGDIWSWGSPAYGGIGNGSTGGAPITSPTIMIKPSGMGKIVQMDSSYYANAALDDKGQIWQWGQVYGRTSSVSLSYAYSPELVLVDQNEINAIGYVPVPQFVSVGESAYYFVDQYDRPWTWGSSRYHGFGREGGVTESRNYFTPKAQQYPKVLGDGSTQTSDSTIKGPPGRTPDASGGYGTANGTGSHLSHPSIYDKKYLDNPEEDIWKNLAFKEIPAVSQMHSGRSSTLLLDKSGNLYRWGFDGSGSIAWGWDYEPQYDHVGANAKDGLYDKYMYEVMYMRGSPNIDPISLQIDKTTKKIYEGITTENSDTVNVKIKIPKAVTSEQMNITVDAELREAKYVIIPYDPTNANFNTSIPTREQFEAEYTAASTDKRGSFLQPGEVIVSGDVDKHLEYPVEITDNCKIWIMINDLAYTRSEDRFAVYTADNFYTPTQVYHNGLNVDTTDPYKQVYDTTSVGYEDANNDGIPDSYYGIPLDVNGKVISAPTFGHDSVDVKALDPLPTTPINLNKYWLWSTVTPQGGAQAKSIPLTFNQSYVNTHPNFADRTPVAKNTHDFYYKKNPTGWVTITYQSQVMPLWSNLNKPDDFIMTPNPESVMVDIQITRTPPVIASYTAIGYYNYASNVVTESMGGTAVLTPTQDMTISFLYEATKRNVYIRQVLIDADEMIKPISGYMNIYSIHNTTGAIRDYSAVSTSSGTGNVPYSKFIYTSLLPPHTQLRVAAIIPEYYTYIGHTLSYTSGVQNPDDRIQGEPVIDFSSETNAWVTLYITPTTKTPGSFNWENAINDFGQIKKIGV